MSFCEDAKNEISQNMPKTRSEKFLAENFIKYGSVTDPTRCYRLEFSLSEQYVSIVILDLLLKLGFTARAAVRGKKFVTYLSSNESIVELLSQIGANNAALSYMGAFIEKDFRNKANRRSNCDNNNMGKLSHAVQEQIEAINLLKSQKLIENLPNTLREAAKLRIENPDASLRELGELSNPPVSRSGINHRLQKILQISKNLEYGG